MKGLRAAVGTITVVKLLPTFASLSLKYSSAVKNSRGDIEYLQEHADGRARNRRRLEVPWERPFFLVVASLTKGWLSEGSQSYFLASMARFPLYKAIENRRNIGVRMTI